MVIGLALSAATVHGSDRVNTFLVWVGRLARAMHVDSSGIL